MMDWQADNPGVATSLWDNFNVPSGVSKQVAVNAILSECSELELVYPDYDAMRAAIANWSVRRLPIWEKLYLTTTLDYDPIENYNRVEEWSDTSEQTTESKDGVTQKASSKSSGTGHSTITSSVKGYDSEQFVGKQQDVTEALDGTENSSTAESNTKREDAGKSNSVHKGYVHGNIGVTTTQKMIREEREIVNYDIYQVIVQDFQERFCLMVW